MGLIARQTFKAASVTYIGVVLGILNQIFLYPLFLTIEEFGEIQFVLQTVGLFTPFLLLGVASVFVKYYPNYSSAKEGARDLYGLGFLVVFINTFLFLGVYLLFETEIASYYCDSSGVSRLTISILFLIAATLPAQALLRTIASLHGRISIPSVLQQLIKVVLPLLCLFYYVEYLTFNTVLYYILAYYIVLLVLYVVYVRSLDGLHFTWSPKRIVSNLEVKPMMVFGAFSLLSGIGAALTNQIDVVMITALKGTFQNGLYSWALFIAGAIAIPYTMISTISMPMISRYWKEKEYQSIDNLYKASSATILLMALIMFLGFWLVIDDLFALMPKGEKFSMAKNMVWLLCVAKIIDMGSGLNSQILSLSDRYRVNLWFLLVAAGLNVALNWLLIPEYGIEGSGVATVVTIIIYNILKYWYLKIKYDLSPFTIKTFYILALTLVVYLGVSYIPKFSYSLANFVVLPLLYGAVTSLVSYKFHLVPELNNFVNKQFRRIGITPFD